MGNGAVYLVSLEGWHSSLKNAWEKGEQASSQISPILVTWNTSQKLSKRELKHDSVNQIKDVEIDAFKQE